jgi:hypothetical protein
MTPYLNKFPKAWIVPPWKQFCANDYDRWHYNETRRPEAMCRQQKRQRCPMKVILTGTYSLNAGLAALLKWPVGK